MVIKRRPLRKARVVRKTPLDAIHKAGEGEFCNALIFGPHGHGKTHLLGTANDDERTAPILILNFEAGTRSLAGSGVDVWDIRTWEDYNDAYDYLTSPECTHKSVGLDSISETQVFGILNILEKDAKRTDPDLMAQQDWGVILVQMRRLVRRFRDLQMHVFFTALAQTVVVAGMGSQKAPLLQGAFKEELPGIVDVVAYLANVGDGDDLERVLLLNSQPKFAVKSRTPWGVRIPSEIVDPTITTLLDALGYKS